MTKLSCTEYQIVMLVNLGIYWTWIFFGYLCEKRGWKSRVVWVI